MIISMLIILFSTKLYMIMTMMDDGDNFNGGDDDGDDHSPSTQSTTRYIQKRL